MSTTIDFNVKHSIPGRIRIQIPALVSRKNMTGRIKTDLSNMPGIDRVLSSHFCGSVTVHYNPEIFSKQHILDMIKGIRWNDPVPLDVGTSGDKEANGTPQSSRQNNGRNTGFQRLWNVAGSISLGVGIVGVFLPLLPTVPLFLMAGFCYWRGSPRFYNRLISFGSIGPLTDNFRRGKGLPAKMKSRSIVFMWISMTTSMVFFVNSNTLRAIMVLVGIGVTLYILWIKTSDPVMNHPERSKIPVGMDQFRGE